MLLRFDLDGEGQAAERFELPGGAEVEEAGHEGNVKAECAAAIGEERGLQVDLAADAEEGEVDGGVLGAVRVAGEVGDELGGSRFAAQAGRECPTEEDAGEGAEDARLFGEKLDVVAAEDEHVDRHADLEGEEKE